ncbi:hypothetical protein BREVNS_0502 [Brevinematales bacterium NS]|nr:hypothetical protein BREVNS_0502 [Brevinematales bacterium NS]
MSSLSLWSFLQGLFCFLEKIRLTMRIAPLFGRGASLCYVSVSAKQGLLKHGNSLFPP